MNNRERLIAYMTKRLGHFGYTEAELDAITSFVLEETNAEVERRRAAETNLANVEHALKEACREAALALSDILSARLFSCANEHEAEAEIRRHGAV